MNLRMNRPFQNGAQEAEEAETETTPDALELIHADHEEVHGLFEQALHEETPSPQRRQIIARICDALTLHAKMEETLFYPALRKAGKMRERDSVLEAGEEHGLMKDMIAKIRKVVGRDETLTAKVKVLKEVVQHHVQEEESTIFDEARQVMGNRLEDLGIELQRFKDRAQRGATTGRRKAVGVRKTTGARTAAAGARKTASARKAPGRKAAPAVATNGRKKTTARGRKTGR